MPDYADRLYARGLISDDAMDRLRDSSATGANADDSGPAFGEAAYASPAMAQMMRRAMGRRLWSQTPSERAQTAEQATRGAAGVASVLNPAVGAATAGATSQFMGDSPQETAAAVGAGLIPGVAGRVARFAPRTAGTVAATMLPASTQSGAADAPLSEADKFEQGYNQRKTQFLKTLEGYGPSRRKQLTDEFEAREDPGRQAARNLDTDRANATLAAKKENDARTQWMTANGPDIQRLKDTTQAQIGGAPDLATAQKIFLAAMREKEDLGKTFAEKHSDWMEGLQLGSAVGGGVLGYRVPAARAARIAQSDRAADAAYLQAYGPGAKTGVRNVAANRNLAELRANQLSEALKLKPFSAGEVGLGAALPTAAGVVVPNAIDAATSTDPDVRARALANINPADPTSWANYGRAAAEGAGASAAGMALGAGRRDFAGVKSRGVGTLNTIRSATAKADQAAADAAAAAQQRAAARANAKKAQSQRLDDMMAANPPRVTKIK